MTVAGGLWPAVCGIGLIAVASAHAQTVVIASPPSVIPSPSTSLRAGSARDLLAFRADSAPLATPALGVASLLVMPFDKRLAALVRKPSLVENSTLQFGAKLFDFWGGGGVFFASGTALALGQAGRSPRYDDLGVATGLAVIGGSLATGALKAAFGRARPYVSADTNPRDFGFGRGLRSEDYRSLPSGHSTAAFAFASAWTSELKRRGDANYRHDGVILYSVAAGVALTRMYQDKHWASDVLLGAAIGILAGEAVARR